MSGLRDFHSLGTWHFRCPGRRPRPSLSPSEPLSPRSRATVRPVTWLRAEGLAVFAAALGAYFVTGGGWPFLLLLFLAPDLSMAGYLGGARVGAAAYNLFHSYVLPLVLLGGGWASGGDLLPRLALVWIAHIGFDRMLGYGLKHDTGFQDTHLGRIGR